MGAPRFRTIVYRAVMVGLAVVVAASVVRAPAPSAPEIDLSTPGAISLAAYSGALDGFLEFTNVQSLGTVEGEARGKIHPNAIEVDSLSSSMSVDRSDCTGPGLCAPIPEIAPLEVKKGIDKSSPLLAQMLLGGLRSDRATISFDRPGTKEEPSRPVVVYEYTDAFVVSLGTDVSTKGNGETLRLTGRALKISYHPVDNRGRPLPPVETCYDQTAHEPCGTA